MLNIKNDINAGFKKFHDLLYILYFNTVQYFKIMFFKHLITFLVLHLIILVI